MRILLVYIAALSLLASTGLGAADYHQTGTTGSGRSQTPHSQLESVISQTIVGTSGNLGSGILSLLVEPTYLPGDVDGNGIVEVSDCVFLISYIFAFGPAPDPLEAADADCNGIVEISDAVFLLNFIFASGPAPQYCF